VTQTGRWTGDPAASPGQASEPAFGWRELFIDPTAAPCSAEQQVAHTVYVRYGVPVKRAGKRTQSYDLEINDRVFARAAGIEPGRYEVKALWRKTEVRAFDPRFKVGRRGEKFYGRRDSLIKAFAVALETQVDHILQDSVSHPGWGKRSRDELTRFVEETHTLIDQAMQRRHSKSFAARFERLAQVSLRIPTMLPVARDLLYNRVQPSDIVGGFADLEGIFLVAGPLYTMVSRDEIAQFLVFDSASSEGVKLRYVGKIPREPLQVRMRQDGDGNLVTGPSQDKDRESSR